MLKSRTIIATPAYRGEVVMQYAHCLVRETFLAIAQGHYVDAPYMVNDTYVHAARNRCLKEFLGTGADYLMFWDADMSCEQGALARVLSLPADMDIVGGLYPTKEDKPEYRFRAMPGIPVEFPMCRVEAIPTGFMRITRNAAERMMRAFGGRPFFHAVIDDLEHGEDILFCRRACLIGLMVHAIFDIEFGLHGPKEYRGRAMDHVIEGSLIPGVPTEQPRIALIA